MDTLHDTFDSDTLFLNGKEVAVFKLTGEAAKDLAAARRFLAEKGLSRPQLRLTPRPEYAAR
jgi:hypothetical protein